MSEPVVTTRLARTSERLVISASRNSPTAGERTTSLAQVSSSSVVATKDVNAEAMSVVKSLSALGDIRRRVVWNGGYAVIGAICLTALAILVFAGL